MKTIQSWLSGRQSSSRIVLKNSTQSTWTNNDEDKALKKNEQNAKRKSIIAIASLLAITIFAFIALYSSNIVSDSIFSVIGTNTDSATETELPPDQWICNSEASCREIHLDAKRLQQILKKRCEIDSLPRRKRETPVCFFHVPKCGGTAVEGTLKSFYPPDRLKISKMLLNESMSHLPFGVWESKVGDDCVFNALFREPVSKAISLYSYIMGQFMTYYQFSPPPNALLDDPLWKKSYYMFRMKRSPLEWFSDPYIKETLQYHTLRHFTPDIKGNYSQNYFRMEIEEEQNKISKQQKPNINTLIRTPKDWTQYSSKMPAQYQCGQYLKVVDLLITRFSAVGTLNSVSLSNYWRVLSNRTGIGRKYEKILVEYNQMLQRRQNDSPKLLDQSLRSEISKLLSPLFFCEKVMLAIIQKIEDKDLTCVLNDQEVDKIKMFKSQSPEPPSGTTKNPVIVDVLSAKIPPPQSETKSSLEKRLPNRVKGRSPQNIPRAIGQGRHDPSLKVLSQGSWRK